VARPARSHGRCAGDITLGDILEILPFEDPLVVIELDGAAIWAALEAALSTGRVRPRAVSSDTARP
jgi:2',3'-cyclic-nucleotide 2'-phosphodiesterase (5'-nucleotidase family)